MIFLLMKDDDNFLYIIIKSFKKCTKKNATSEISK